MTPPPPSKVRVRVREWVQMGEEEGGVEHQQDEGDEVGGHVGERARDVRRRISRLYPGRM